MTLTPLLVVYFAGLATGAFIDFRTGRLPNWLTFSMMALGIAMWTTEGEPLVALGGIAVAFAIHFPLFALNVVRAGDAKLVMGAAACVGMSETIDLTAWYAILYIPVGLANLAAKRRFGNLVKVAKGMADQARGLPQSDQPEELTMLRTGPIIAAAGVMAAFTDWLTVW